MDASAIRAALSCERPVCPCHRANGHNTHCYSHDGDRQPSLTVHDKPGGGVLVNCKAGCDQATVVAYLKSRSLWPEREAEPVPFRAARKAAPERPQQPRNIVAVYEYKDAAGAVVAEKARLEWPEPGEAKPAKSFLWRRPGDQTWSGGIGPAQSPLFGADLVAVSPPDQPVIFVEGESAALACQARQLLAVCFGGGASSVEFGESLEILRGRDVRLWPDNDVPGRRYMARVNAKLRPVAHSVLTLQPTVDQEKDDAVDYFQNGGTVEALLGNLPPLRPSVRYIDDDAITVDLPTPFGCATYEFSEITIAPRDLNCEVSVLLRGPGQPTEAMPQRLNVLSATSVTEFRRNLDSFFPRAAEEKHFWTTSTVRAISLMRDAMRENDGTVHISEIPDSGPPSWLVQTLLPEHRPSIFFGNGESGKTWMTARIALAVALSGEVERFPALTGPVLYLDWETDSETWKDRIRRIGRGMGYTDAEVLGAPIFYNRVKGTAFAEMVSTLRHRIEHDNIRLLIVDSISAACGTPPEESESAQRFINAFNRLPSVTLLALAHVSKESDTKTPFGSSMWFNFFRSLWYIEKHTEPESSEMDIGMFQRKLNDGRRSRPIGWSLSFDDRDPGVPGDVTFRANGVENMPELADRLDSWSRIAGFLRRDGRATVVAIGEELGLPVNAVRTVLNRHKTEVIQLSPGVKGSSSAYALRGPEER